MIHHSVSRSLLVAGLFFPAVLFAQEPFHFPTANHYLFQPGKELDFFAPTEHNKPWTSGSFGCVRDYRHRIHEGLDIRCLRRDKHGEPTDPVMATADGTVVFFNTRPALSNYGNYVVIQHLIDGIQIYSLYAHLSEIRPGLRIGQTVKTGEVIGTMGRTSNADHIAKWRAHVHFELDLFINDRFPMWFKKTYPHEHNDFGKWNGLNLNALDARQILLNEHTQGPRFNLLDFIRSQPVLCRVVVRATNFPFLKRYPMLVVPNHTAEKEGVAGYEIALDYNAVPISLMPLAASEIKGKAKFQLLSVNEPVELANPCRHLLVKRRGHWYLTETGRRELELLTY